MIITGNLFHCIPTIHVCPHLWSSVVLRLRSLLSSRQNSSSSSSCRMHVPPFHKSEVWSSVLGCHYSPSFLSSACFLAIKHFYLLLFSLTWELSPSSLFRSKYLISFIFWISILPSNHFNSFSLL